MAVGSTFWDEQGNVHFLNHLTAIHSTDVPSEQKYSRCCNE